MAWGSVEKADRKVARRITEAPDTFDVPKGAVKMRVQYTDGSMSRESTLLLDSEYRNFKKARMARYTAAQIMRELGSALFG